MQLGTTSRRVADTAGTHFRKKKETRAGKVAVMARTREGAGGGCRGTCGRSSLSIAEAVSGGHPTDGIQEREGGGR